MLRRIEKILRPDGFTPTSAVFPNIDSERLARDLRLDEQGKIRGAENQPASSATEFDLVETGIIERIEEFRRKGLENYEAHRRVYNERLARAGQASKEVEIAAGAARNDFGTLVQKWQTGIEAARDRLHETFSWRRRFREIHRLERPAVDFDGWVGVVALIIIFIVLEAGINSYLFSKGNEFGLLGGILAAAIVSVVNVGGSFVLGYLARYLHHRNYFLKLFGVAFFLCWIGFAVAISLGTAHFRDGLEAGQSWSLAAMRAVPEMVERPFDLASIESWLLAGIGIIISFAAMRKGWHTDDPYPGYGRVERQLGRARAEYEDELRRALDDLQSRRDQAIDELKDANDEVGAGIGEAVDALFGQTALSAHLKAFLEQCDVKAAHLLAIYRDANRSARSEPAPKSFDRSHRFVAFKPEPVEQARRKSAEAEAARVAETVDDAIRDIFSRFESARQTFDVTRAVQRDGDPEPRSI